MEQLLSKDENENNEIVSNVFLGLSGLILIIWLFEILGVFEVYFNIISTFAIILIILFMVPVVMVRLTKLRKPFIKYAFILDMSLITGVCYIFFTNQMVIMFLCPVLIALLYMNKRVLWFAEIVSLIALIASHIVSASFVVQPWIEYFTRIDDIIRFNLIPRLLQILACFAIINVLMSRVIGYFAEYDKVILEGKDHDISNGNKIDMELENFISLLNKLTESEKNVFLMLLHGKTNKQISEELSFSNGTVKNYVSSIYNKLECRERSYLILKYSAILSKYDHSHMK